MSTQIQSEESQCLQSPNIDNKKKNHFKTENAQNKRDGQKNSYISKQKSSIKSSNCKTINHLNQYRNLYLVIIIIILSTILAFQIIIMILSNIENDQILRVNYQKLLAFNKQQRQKYSISQTKMLSSANVRAQNLIKMTQIINQQKKSQKITNKIQKSTNTQSHSIPPFRTPMNNRMVAGISGKQQQLSRKLINLKDFNFNQINDLAQQEYNYYESKYNISKYEELPFCIVVPSFNNAKDNRHIKNMKSILQQNYKNYHIVFLDDASTDQTGEEIKLFLKNQSRLAQNKYLIIRNSQKKNAMPNLRRAAQQFCKPQEIFLIVDGDDELIGRQVFKLFNSIFQSEQVWFVYTNFLSVRGTVGYSRPFPQKTINDNSYRSYPFITSHLRAFYTQLFINIKEQDLKDEQGSYLKAANDVAICIPILEQSHKRVRYVPQITYLYNSNTGLNNHMIRLKQQKDNDRKLRKKQKYKALQNLFDHST